MVSPAELLHDLGLSDGETKVYLALLKLGPSTVHRIKEEASLHRTTVYDFIAKLIDKGLVSYVIKNGTREYKASNVAKLKDYLKEKEEKLNEALPRLQQLQSYVKESFSVEVREGREGFKHVLNLVLKERKDVYCLGADEAQFDEKYHYELENFFKKEKQLGINERALTRKNASYIYSHHSQVEYRFLPEEHFSPLSILIFSEYVIIQDFHNDASIIIHSATLAESYKKTFSHLWNIADKQPARKKSLRHSFKRTPSTSRV